MELLNKEKIDTKTNKRSNKNILKKKNLLIIDYVLFF